MPSPQPYPVPRHGIMLMTFFFLSHLTLLSYVVLADCLLRSFHNFTPAGSFSSFIEARLQAALYWSQVRLSLEYYHRHSSIQLTFAKMSFFETEFSLLDPSSQFDESNFLSFSSLIELCPPTLDSNNLNAKVVNSNRSSSISSPSLSEPSDVLNDDFQPSTPKCGQVGIFHTPPKSTNDYEECDLFTPEHTLSSPMDAFITPIKSSKSSVSGYDQYGYITPADSIFLSSTRSNFPWDDVSSNLSGATYQTPSVTPRAMRVASNPTLDAPRNPRFVKQVVSMPLLKEEPLNTESDWDNSKSFVMDEQQGMDVGFVSSRAPVNGFDNVFGGFNTGENGVNTAASILTFQSPESLDSSTQYTTNTVDIQSIPSSSSSMPMLSWQPQTSTMQDHVGLFPAIEISQPDTHVAGPIGDFTINPKAVMCSNEGESLVRPSTAPGFRDQETTVPLGPPISEPMNRRYALNHMQLRRHELMYI